MTQPADRRLAYLLAASAATHLVVLLAAGWRVYTPVSFGNATLQVSLLAPVLERRNAGSIPASRPATKAAPATALTSLVAGLKSAPVRAHTTQPQHPVPHDQSRSTAPGTPTTRGDGGRNQQTEAAVQAYGQTLHDRLMQALHARFFYPLLARREGWQGVVRLLLHIEPDGRISDTRIVRTSGYPVLDEAAVRSVRDIAKVRADDAPSRTAFFDLNLTVVYRLTDS